MNPAGIALIAENFVLLAVIAAGWHLLRQGGGLQLKTAPAPKAPAKPTPDAATAPADGDAKTGPVPLGRPA